jgi:hypothetical protein
MSFTSRDSISFQEETGSWGRFAPLTGHEHQLTEKAPDVSTVSRLEFPLKENGPVETNGASNPLLMQAELFFSHRTPVRRRTCDNRVRNDLFEGSAFFAFN